MAVQRWYPQRGDFESEQVYNAHRQAFDQIYSLQDQLNTLHSSLKGNSKVSAVGSENGGPSNTTINGLYVKAVPPKNGQVLKFSSSSGQIEWS
jgi:hypothetical protein